MFRTTTKIIIAQEDGVVVGQYFLGQGEHLIGREDHCTIQLEADQVSREHAKLIISVEAIEIEDLNSTSGTYLDGVTVKGRIPLAPGQKLWISNLYIDIERQGFGGLIEGSRVGDGRFTLQRELGKGGMGAVWLALDEEVNENVALKLVSDEAGMDSKGLKDLQREVNKSHKLVHPNIVRMGYLWKKEGEPPFISLEYVDGTDLHRIRENSPDGLLAWEEVQAYMIQLCDALEYAHSQKVAHRDIKPGNFMITSGGNLKLADFGIAATLADTASTFTSNTVLGSGTPPYMSPQQLDGKRPQVTDDIYSVGATLYDLLTSKPPFYHGDVSYQVRHEEVTLMVERLKELKLKNDIPEYVSAIVMACLQKDSAKRPQSMLVIREWIEKGERVVPEMDGVAGVIESADTFPMGMKQRKLPPCPRVPVIRDYIWGFETGSAVDSSPAIAVDNTIYVGSDDNKVYALDGKTGVKKWEFVAQLPVQSSPAIGDDGTVYVGANDNKLYALEGKNGAKKWEFETGGDVRSSPSIGADGTVYIGSNNAKVYALNGKTGIKKWEFETGDNVESTPAIGAFYTSGAVYIGSLDSWVYALDGKTGAKKWEFETGGGVLSSPAIGADGTVYIGSLDYWIYALDGKTGVPKWEFETGGAVISSPAIGVDGTVYVGSRDKKVYALDGKTGVPKWEFETGGIVISSPSIGVDGTVYTSSWDGKFYALDGKTGASQWEFVTGLQGVSSSGVRSSPVIGTDGTVYIGSIDGRVHAFKTKTKGLAKSPWPMWGQNGQHTGRASK